MDMTLLDHGPARYGRMSAIPESAKRALDALRGHAHIVLATGRDMGNYSSRGFLGPVNPDAVIHNNGARVTVGDEVIYEYRMDRALIRDVLDFCVAHGICMGATIGELDYYTHPEGIQMDRRVRFGMKDREFGDPYELLGMEVHSLAHVGDSNSRAGLVEAFPGLKFLPFSADFGADVVEQAVSKAEGLRKLCDYWQSPISGAVAFGDSLNDYEIVRDAGTGVAMGNAVQALKDVADYVTAPIDEDGIWKACVALGILGEDGRYIGQ